MTRTEGLEIFEQRRADLRIFFAEENSMDERFGAGLKLAEKAGFFLKESRSKVEVFKTTDYDVKLKQDTASEEIIIGAVEKMFPADGYVSEERGSKESVSGYVWTVDPLDGTVNYSRGIPHCCVSIACRNKKGAFGIVHDFFRGETFTGMTGKGAFLNGEKISASPVESLKNAIVSFGLMKGKEEIRSGLSVLSDVALKVKKVRSMGAAALDLCYIAAGRTDMFFEVGLYPWDVAAGRIIIVEAGGRYLEFSSGSQTLSCASNGHLDTEGLCRNLLKT
jgi:myo-inositol-1(or 4)-monophosphatase